MDQPQPKRTTRLLSGPNLVRAAIGLAVVAAAFVWVLPTFADYSQVWPRLRHLRTPAAWLLVVVGCFNLVAPSISQVAALPGLTLRRAVVADWATTAVTNLVPGGSALAIGLIWSMYRRWRLAGAAIARSIVVTGIWDLMVKLALPLPAVAWLATQRPVTGVLVQAAIVGAVLLVAAVGLLVAVLVAPGLGRWAGGLIDRLPVLGQGWPERFDRQRNDTLALLAERGWGLTFWTVVGHANLYLLLLVCLRAVGVDGAELSAAAVLAAFAFGRLVTALPVTPGGLGVMEVGLVGSLVAFARSGPVDATAGGGRAGIVAAVLLFRLLSYAAPLPLGALSLAWWGLVGRDRAPTADPSHQPMGID